MTQGLLFVLSEPEPGDEATFHDWYDNEHAPARTAMAGFHAGRRYRAADGATPSWLAVYDLELEVLRSEDYQRLRTRRSARERQVIAGLRTLDRRVYELTGTHGAAPERLAPALVATLLSVAPEHESELHRWYEEEHIPMLLKTPGWNRIRRYRKTDGPGPVFLALHEIDGVEAFGTDQYRTATTTPWRRRIHRYATARERRVFTFHNSVAEPPAAGSGDEKPGAR
ncbi:hypothetical protein ABZT04_22175 [Streptomyces sp. NPDC005492]|uniref:hypothetical protein n=1 Tax=Streptomyces sp. NPDC005492 TaxID=3156883 RepID=UPI00339FEB88